MPNKAAKRGRFALAGEGVVSLTLKTSTDDTSGGTHAGAVPKRQAAAGLAIILAWDLFDCLPKRGT